MPDPQQWLPGGIDPVTGKPIPPWQYKPALTWRDWLDIPEQPEQSLLHRLQSEIHPSQQFLPGLSHAELYSPTIGSRGWRGTKAEHAKGFHGLSDEAKKAWWETASPAEREQLRAALNELPTVPKKLGAPHSTGPPYKLGPSVRSMPNTLSPLMPGDVPRSQTRATRRLEGLPTLSPVPLDVQRPTEKIITGPLRQAIEEEILGTPGREPIVPHGDIAARDAELFGLGELDVAMDEAIAGGVLRKELGQYGDEFEGIYQYFKSRGVPESKISEFWKRTINQMGDFEGKTIWEVEGTQDLINTQTGDPVLGLKDKSGRLRVYQPGYTGSQPTEERMIREEVQKLVDGGMHRGDQAYRALKRVLH